MALAYDLSMQVCAFCVGITSHTIDAGVSAGLVVLSMVHKTEHNPLEEEMYLNVASHNSYSDLIATV